jgi:hypothetical protein
VEKNFNPLKYSNYFKFGFVRNPWARIVSCYFNKVVSKEKRMSGFKECFGKDFDYFVDFINRTDLSTANRHIKLQTKLLPLTHIDFIGRLENFDKDMGHIGKVLGLRIVKVSKQNKTKHLHYSQYYTERTKRIIAEKYKEDIEAFGYTFETK